MRVAQHVTATAQTRLLQTPDTPTTLVVTRFDRSTTEAGTVRIHQEDGAQAMGIGPDA